ncbi:hypothetical protein G6011_07453 [Alternaria panax]|uniref:Uncharacterized protein n=1 Tax=Alternaria panax TaxID=48097 RepID=A0AAD4FGW8_9PLEO|nr:hypothetical protein G6011_07453 [Alternaria panax]
MTEPASNLDSACSTLPTTLPTPNTQGNKAHARRPSQVAEIIEKVNARLRRIFGSRRGSAEDEFPPLNLTVTQRSSTSDNTSRPSEDLYIQYSPKDLAGMGLAALPNVSEFFDINSEVGPSCFYGTTDWDAFQATLRAQRRNILQSQLNADLHYDGDSDLEQLEKFRQYDTRTEKCEERERKDSQFSFSDFLKPRRFSKVKKGKGRMVYDNEVGSVLRDQLLPSPYQDASLDADGPSLVRTGVQICAPSGKGQILISEESVPCGSQVIIGPLQSSAPGSTNDYNASRRPVSSTRKVSVRLVPSTPYYPRDERRSSMSSTTSSSSVTSFGSPTPATRPSRNLCRLAGNIVAKPTTIAAESGADMHSDPISIPSSYHNSHRSSVVAIGSARPTNDSPTLPLLSHGYRPDTRPSPPSLPHSRPFSRSHASTPSRSTTTGFAPAICIE